MRIEIRHTTPTAPKGPRLKKTDATTILLRHFDSDTAWKLYTEALDEVRTHKQPVTIALTEGQALQFKIVEGLVKTVVAHRPPEAANWIPWVEEARMEIFFEAGPRPYKLEESRRNMYDVETWRSAPRRFPSLKAAYDAAEARLEKLYDQGWE